MWVCVCAVHLHHIQGVQYEHGDRKKKLNGSRCAWIVYFVFLIQYILNVWRIGNTKFDETFLWRIDFVFFSLCSCSRGSDLIMWSSYILSAHRKLDWFNMNLHELTNRKFARFRQSLYNRKRFFVVVFFFFFHKDA